MVPILGVLTLIGTSFASASGVGPLLAPQLMSRDLPVIIEAMDLDKQQSAILDDLLAEYLTRFDAEQSEVEAALAAVDPDTLHDAWIPPDWTDQRSAWRSVRAEAAELEDAAEARAYLESQQGWARREMEGLLRDRPDPSPSPRTQILNGWLTRREALRDGLIHDLGLVLDPQRASRWNMVEAAIARQRTPFGEVLPGESLDLGRVLRSQFTRDDPLPLNLEGLIGDYERAWGEASAARDAELAALLPRRLDAVERKDMLGQLQIARREAAARRTLVDANLDWYKRFTEALLSERINAFQRAVNERVHPDIFLPSLPERVLDQLLEDPALDSGLRSALVQSRMQFGAPRLSVAANERSASRQAAPRRLVARAEQRAMADVFGPTALFQLEKPTEVDPLSQVTRLSSRRRSIDAAWLKHVQDLIGTQRWADLPTNVKLPPKPLREQLVDQEGKPLRLILLP